MVKQWVQPFLFPEGYACSHEGLNKNGRHIAGDNFNLSLLQNSSHWSWKYLPPVRRQVITATNDVDRFPVMQKIGEICTGIQYLSSKQHHIRGVVQGHDDVIKWKHFPRYWPFARGIHRWPVNSPHKGQWRGALIFSLICVWINGWVNNREADDLRRYRAHNDVTIIETVLCLMWAILSKNVATLSKSQCVYMLN